VNIISRKFYALFFAASSLVFASCGYDGGYRYSCQDPENWDNKECQPPICEVDGNCTKYLLGFNPNEPSTTLVEVTEEIAP